MEFFFQERPQYQVEKKKEMGMPEIGVLEEGSLLQDCLTVKFQYVKLRE